LSRIIKSQYSTVDTSNIIIINGNQEAFIPQNLAAGAGTVYYDNPEAEQTVEEAMFSAKNIIENAKREAELEAANILNNAKLTADQIVEASNQKAALDYAAELERAKQEGEEQAIAETKEEVEKMLAEAENIRLEAVQYKEDFIAKIEPEVIDLVISIMDKIIGSEKVLNKYLASILVKQGLNEVPLADDITVHLSPEDYDSVDQLEIMKALDHVANVNIVMDVMLKPTDCIIETSLGNLNCGLDTKYEALKDNLKYILANG